MEQIGVRLITNHHLLSEDLFAKHLAEVPLQLDEPDPEIAAAPDLTKAIIDRSSREAAEIYRLAWRFSAPTLRDGVSGHEFDGAKGDDPDAYVDKSPEARVAIDRFYAIEARGLRRAVTALREWQRRFPGPAHDPVPGLLVYHSKAAERRAAWRPAVAGKASVAWGYPIALMAVVAAISVRLDPPRSMGNTRASRWRARSILFSKLLRGCSWFQKSLASSSRRFLTCSWRRI